MNHEQPEQATLQHASRSKARLEELMNYLRQEGAQVKDPQARALFETSAEVLGGLVKAFDDFEQKTEAAWQAAGQSDSKNAWPQQDASLK